MDQSQFNKKYRIYQIIFIISLVVVWIPASFGSGLLIEDLQNGYLSSIINEGEEIFSNGGIFTIVPNVFILLFAWIYFFNWIMLKIFKLPSWEMDKRSWKAAKQAKAPEGIGSIDLSTPKKGNRLIKIMAIIIIPLGLITNVLLFFMYTKTTDTGLVNRNFFQQEKKYNWDNLQRITFERQEDGDPWYELFFTNDRVIRLNSYLSNPDAEAIASIGSERTELEIISL